MWHFVATWLRALPVFAVILLIVVPIIGVREDLFLARLRERRRSHEDAVLASLQSGESPSNLAVVTFGRQTRDGTADEERAISPGSCSPVRHWVAVPGFMHRPLEQMRSPLQSVSFVHPDALSRTRFPPATLCASARISLASSCSFWVTSGGR